MKKMVKLLSVMLLLTMLFGMMATGASAIVNDGSTQSGGIVIGGSSGSEDVFINDSGNLVIGAEMRPEDDSPYTGARIEDSPSYDSQKAAAAAAASGSSSDIQAKIAAAAAEEAQKYLGKADGDYSGIVDSEYSLVQANQDFLRYIRDNLETIDTATLQTALDLFGEEAVYGPDTAEVDEEAAKADLAEVEARIAEIEAEFLATTTDVSEVSEVEAAAAAESTETAAAEGAETAEAAEAETVEAVAEEPAAAPSIWDNEEYVQLQIQKEAITMALNGSVTLKAVPSTITSNWSSVCATGKSLASAVAPGGRITFLGPSFDICNSTDYRITVDLCGTTIDATACDAAFTIQDGSYGGTVTFTNGTINGDGFYVFNGGVLNLGGLINTTYVDITVNAKNNAVYVDDTGYCVIGQGTTLNGWLPAASATTYPTYSTEPVVYIASGGTVVMTGGSVNVGPSGSATGCGIRSVGGTLELSSSVAEVISKNDEAPAIYGSDGSVINMHGGYVYGSTGIAVAGSSTTLTVNGGAVTGYRSVAKEFPNNGAAIFVDGNGIDAGPLVYCYGGTLRSEYTAGVTVNPHIDPSDTATRSQITRVVVDDLNVTIQEKYGEKSDYAQSVYIVTSAEGTFGFGNAVALNAALPSLTGTISIKMIADDTVTTEPVTLDGAAATAIVFDGNGHTIKDTAGVGGIIVSDGNVTVKNVTVNGTHTGSAIIVAAGNVVIGPGVVVEHFTDGLVVDGGVVNVNGYTAEKHTDIGIYCSAGETTVSMCKIDSDIPVDGSNLKEPDFLRISGGWFLHKEDVTATTTPLQKVATYVDPDVSYVKYVEADRYYEVLYNDTPTVEIKSGATGYDTDKIPYVMYDKSNPDPIIFTVTPAVVQIYAVSETGKEYPIFTAEAGKSGDIRIPDSAVLNDCPSGKYDLKFVFKNGYILEGKLRFYVFPKYAGLFKVDNILSLSPDNGNIVKYLIDENKTDVYNVGSQQNIAIVMSELPDDITIGNVPDGSSETLLANYILIRDNATNVISGDETTWGVVPSGPYAGYYFYFISYADLNNLAVGQNYVFLGWDGINGALKRLPLTVKNTAVSISPTSIDWSSIDSYANFTVKPGVDTVYIDGNKVEDGYWSYNTSNHVLSIKGSYLSALTKTDHTLEVITPQGKVSATIKTGIGLRAKDVDYHVYGGARSLSFIASDKINQEAGIWIGSSNPTKLDTSAYTWDSTTGFTLNAAFLNRLALGTYYISAYVYNGSQYQYTTTTFKVISASQASYNPSTGDNSNIVLWIVILLLSAVAIVVILLPKLRKGKQGK